MNKNLKTRGKLREALSEIDLSLTTGKLKEPDLTTEEGRKEARERKFAGEQADVEIESMRRGREKKE